MEQQTLPEIEQSEFSSPVNNLKTLLTTVTSQALVLKNMTTQIKSLIKDVERQSKELEKFRNRKSRVKAQRKEGSAPSGITKPVSISDELAVFLGFAPGTLVPRNEVTKGVSEYVRAHQLFDVSNKQKFVLNTKPEGKKLMALLGNPKDEVTYFNLQRYLKPHYLSVGEPSGVVAETKIVEPVPAPAAPSTEPVVEKKTKLVKKKKSTESAEPLAEEV